VAVCGPKLQPAPHWHLTQAQLTVGTPAQTMTGTIAHTRATLNQRLANRIVGVPTILSSPRGCRAINQAAFHVFYLFSQHRQMPAIHLQSTFKIGVIRGPN
jgi:hypothetical protein